MLHGFGIKHSHTVSSSNEENINVRAAFIHVVGDTVQSVGVLIAALIIKYKVRIAVWSTASITVDARLKGLKPGSHEQHKHKDKINTKTKHDISSGTCEDKTTRIFLCFVFCSAHGLCLDYDLMLMITTILMSQARLHSFVLPFVLSLCLCSRVNQALHNTPSTHLALCSHFWFTMAEYSSTFQKFLWRYVWSGCFAHPD